jgi:hypothetical protein
MIMIPSKYGKTPILGNDNNKTKLHAWRNEGKKVKNIKLPL